MPSRHDLVTYAQVAAFIAATALLLYAWMGATLDIAAASERMKATSSQDVQTVTMAGTCHEDEPCWTWSTMGNLDRGVYVHGRDARRVVDACTFAYLAHRGRVDWTRTRALKGDRLAQRHGCNPRKFG